MASFVHGYLPIALIPPTIPSKILNTFEVYRLNEEIPWKLIAAYYTFEVVRNAYMSDEGLHLLIEFPLYTRHGVHDVFRATPIPQPIPQTERATQYHLSKTHLLMSWTKRILLKLPNKNSPPIAGARTGYDFANSHSQHLSRRRRLY